MCLLVSYSDSSRKQWFVVNASVVLSFCHRLLCDILECQEWVWSVVRRQAIPCLYVLLTSLCFSNPCEWSSRISHDHRTHDKNSQFDTDTFTTTTTHFRTPMPYVAHKRIVPMTGYATSPSRLSPVRVYGSPVRVIRSPVRVYGSPIRVISSPVRTVVRAVRSPVRVISSPARVVTIRSSYLRPSILNKEFDRIERKYRSSPVSSALEQYYNSPSYLVRIDVKTQQSW